eukprot:212740_1
METLSAVFLITHCFALISSTCNYIDFGSYAIPESVCVEEDIYVTETRATFSLSYKYECNSATQMQKPNWVCWATGQFMTSSCAFQYCPTSSPNGHESKNITVGDLGHNYQGPNSYDNLPVINIQCNQNTNCDYVKVKNYDQDPSGLPFNGNIIPIVINECISKKKFGCNQNNYWRVDYKDNQCTQPISIYYYDIQGQTATYPQHTVEECTSITAPPANIPLYTPLPMCVTAADLTFLNQMYSWIRFDETINSDIFQCKSCQFDAYLHGYTTDSGSQFLILGPTETTANAWAICYVGSNGATYKFNINDCQTWFKWDSTASTFVADPDMEAAQCTPQPTLSPITTLPTTERPTSGPTTRPTPSPTSRPAASPIANGQNAMENDEISQQNPLNKENEKKGNVNIEMYLIIGGIALVISVFIFIGVYMICKKRKNNKYVFSGSSNQGIVMEKSQSGKVDGEDEEFV